MIMKHEMALQSTHHTLFMEAAKGKQNLNLVHNNIMSSTQVTGDHQYQCLMHNIMTPPFLMVKVR